jgi:hypothetical protein
MEREDQAVRERFIAAINAHGGNLPMDDPTSLAVTHVDEVNLPKLDFQPLPWWELMESTLRFC